MEPVPFSSEHIIDVQFRVPRSTVEAGIGNEMTLNAKIFSMPPEFVDYMEQTKATIEVAREDVEINKNRVEYLTPQVESNAQAAAASAHDASESEDLADTHANNAGTSAGESANSAATSLASEQKAKSWAEEPEDLEVEPGKHSAMHHALKAGDSATAAEDSAAAALMSEGKAANSETAAANSEQAALSSQMAASNSRDAAADSELSAATSASEAAASRDTAGTSADAAMASEQAAAASEGNAGASAAAALASEQAAKTSEDNAKASETASAGSASQAATSESNAQTSATNAAMSETNAAGSATAAQAAQTAAESARNSAEALFDQFGDQYLGDHPSDPATDNDGNPLQTGAVYFNTTSEVLKFYSGSTWVSPENVATTAASEAQSSANAAATSESNAAASASAAGTSETNAAASESAAASSESSAAVSAQTASTAATNAGNSESAAATSEDNAATSATSAASSASAASTSETNAADSASAAAQSEANAAQAVDDALAPHVNATDPHPQYLTEDAASALLSDKSSKGHGHSIGDVTGLQDALNGKLANGAKAADSALLDGKGPGSFLRSDTDDHLEATLHLRGDLVGEDAYRHRGLVGTYDSTKVQHIWSMGDTYRVDSNGATFGNLYGLAYYHPNNGQGNMGGSHQVVWCHSGAARSAMGQDLWTSGDVIRTSDARVKTNLDPLSDSLATVLRLTGYRYDRLDNPDAPRQVGVLAQEVLAVLPEAVRGGPDARSPDGLYAVAYDNLVPVLIEAIKEQQRQIDALRYPWWIRWLFRRLT